MNLAEKVKKKAADDLAKLAKIKKWAARAKKLGSRKKALRISEGEFCRRYGINAARFNRVKNLKDDYLPFDEFIDQVEAAFKAEGI